MTTSRILLATLGLGAAFVLTTGAQSKVPNPITGEGLPNPAPKVTRNWGELPAGRKWGTSAGLDVDPKDGNIWGYERCGAGARRRRRRPRRLRQPTRSIRCSSSIATPARCSPTSARA